ncbi:MAG: YHS domain-containing protein, partial [Myxococcota bacterium]
GGNILAGGAGQEGSSVDQAAAKKDKTPPKFFASPQKEGVKATCPVTGEEFTINKDTLHSEYKGRYVYFCCAGCKPEFDKTPAKFLKDIPDETNKKRGKD